MSRSPPWHERIDLVIVSPPAAMTATRRRQPRRLTVAGIGDDGSLHLRPCQPTGASQRLRERPHRAGLRLHRVRRPWRDRRLRTPDRRREHRRGVGVRRGDPRPPPQCRPPVADSVDEARQQWVEVFNRDRADLGPGHAATRVDEDTDRHPSNAEQRSPPVPQPCNEPAAHGAPAAAPKLRQRSRSPPLSGFVRR